MEFRLSDSQKNDFVSDGYVILRDFIPSKALEAATSYVDQAYENGEYQQTTRKILGEDIPVPDFNAQVKTAPEIVDLMFRTPLQGVIDDLFGKDLAAVRDNQGQIVFIPPCNAQIEQGMSVHKSFPKRRWHVDGGNRKYHKKASGFSLLVSVAISDGQQNDQNGGQMMLWPGKSPNYKQSPEFVHAVFFFGLSRLTRCGVVVFLRTTRLTSHYTARHCNGC